jgi:hypothetical protein
VPSCQRAAGASGQDTAPLRCASPTGAHRGHITTRSAGKRREPPRSQPQARKHVRYIGRGQLRTCTRPGLQADSPGDGESRNSVIVNVGARRRPSGIIAQVEAPEYYEGLANQDLDRTLQTDNSSSRAEDIARAQIHALLAVASALNRLAAATQWQG